MPYPVDSPPVMDLQKPEVTVIDVYDLASEIGREFEKIIDVYGVGSITSLMPKVINALELLEGLAAKSDQENGTIQDLHARIAKLEREKAEKQRFEKEVEQIEDLWRKEVQEYQTMIHKLKEDKVKLSRLLALSQDESLMSNTQAIAPEVDVITVQQLNNIVEQLKRQLRTKDRELASKSTEIENLSNQVERLTSLKKEFRRKQNISQTQMRELAEERADLLAQLQDKRKEVKNLCHRLGIAQKENEDLANLSAESPDLSNKLIFDVHDPNRPRFTTSELKDILQERNELKVKNNDLEEELETFRPKPQPKVESQIGKLDYSEEVKVGRKTFKHASSVSGLFPVQQTYEYSGHNEHRAISALFPRSLPPTVTISSPEDEDPPVQGPLPCEPDDAPWKKSESGIRKFFRKLFSESNQMSFLGNSPKRSLSTLSKISVAAGPSSNVEALP